MKKVAFKSSILIPIFMTYFVLLGTPSLSIIEVGLYLNWSQVLVLYISFTLMWLCCSPLRKSCCDGGVMEVVFNVIPVFVFSFLVFAQWHFYISLILMFGTIFFQIFTAIWLKVEKCNKVYFKKHPNKYRIVNQRVALLNVAVFCAIPCFFSIFVYEIKPPTYKANDDLWSTLFENYDDESSKTENGDIYAQNVNLLQYFSESQWSDLNIHEKIAIAQALVDFESERLKIPKVSIITLKMGAFTLGQYDSDSNEIKIDIEHLDNSSPADCITTICHETYHAAQFYILSNIDWANKVFQTSYFQELQQWHNNEKDYQQLFSSGLDAYKNQPLEVSARTYAEKETEQILSYVIS